MATGSTMSAGAGWVDYKPEGGWEESGSGRPDLSINPPGVRDPKQDILTPSAYRQKVAAGPFAKPGGAEEAMGEGLTNKEQLAEGGKSLLQAGAETGAGMIGAPLIAAGIPAAAPAVSRVAANHPFATRAIASSAIAGARHIPYVGKFVPPMAEMIPFLGGGGAKEEPPVREPIGESRIPPPSKPSGRLVLTPSEAQAEAKQMQNATRMASQRGMQYAAGQKPED